ncbi:MULTISPECIES: hypothetical protein [unclassified Mesorhizobium]|uniref:hypothetical protein n=1 Tax=unclassified Mesorhizobium TaxID=325217 RepID=UPI000FCC1E8D|nr:MULTISPECIES: hypothetical protein [unclassified Mesorhizobium]RUX95943.1 hypothetical protein EN993_09665 [Mesorhizobium sp. M7D.F.Ca.US.004.01.2.1]RVA32771.1 hypothetical protein EN935_10910 [Mesorhizobium sp. M7D.F.Ca.US.004.03.1.1]
MHEEPYTNWRGDKVTRQNYVTIPSESWAFRVVVKSLTPNRKGNSFSDPNDVVVIAEQAFGSK